MFLLHGTYNRLVLPILREGLKRSIESGISNYRYNPHFVYFQSASTFGDLEEDWNAGFGFSINNDFVRNHPTQFYSAALTPEAFEMAEGNEPMDIDSIPLFPKFDEEFGRYLSEMGITSRASLALMFSTDRQVVSSESIPVEGLDSLIIYQNRRYGGMGHMIHFDSYPLLRGIMKRSDHERLHYHSEKLKEELPSHMKLLVQTRTKDFVKVESLQDLEDTLVSNLTYKS